MTYIHVLKSQKNHQANKGSAASCIANDNLGSVIKQSNETAS